MIIIIIKRLCYHAICQMNAIAIAMQAMNRGRDDDDTFNVHVDLFRLLSSKLSLPMYLQDPGSKNARVS